MSDTLSPDAIARRVVSHQAVDAIVDARPDEGAHDALSFALDHLAAAIRRVVALDGRGEVEEAKRHGVEGAWQAIAAIAQGQLEQAMEARAS